MTETHLSGTVSLWTDFTKEFATHAFYAHKICALPIRNVKSCMSSTCVIDCGYGGTGGGGGGGGGGNSNTDAE